jgi:hypothetical protein
MVYPYPLIRHQIIFLDIKPARKKAVAADNDDSSGKGVRFHGCPAAGHSREYCKGYESGYNDEGVFKLAVAVLDRNNQLFSYACFTKSNT